MRRLITTFTLLLGLAPAQAQGPSAATQAGTLTVAFLDVGQGDSILVRSPEGKAALIDAGPSKDIVPLLTRLGVRSLDLVVVTHHHADHYGGMDDVIRAFRPRVLLATGSAHTTPTYLKLLTLVRDSGMRAIFPTDASRKVELGSVVLTALPQPPEDESEENDNSIGIRVQYGEFSALLTGDSESGERAYWERHAPELVRGCTVLKLAHHGSRNGTDARWLGLVRPQLAVASLGRGNPFGHPHPETLALLARHRIPLSRTDIDGTVRVVSDGKTWGVAGRPLLARGPPDRDEEVAQAKGRHAAGTGPPGRLIDINSASQTELETLPGAGPVIARRIIAGRPYRTIEELRRIQGIGEERMGRMRPHVTAR